MRRFSKRAALFALPILAAWGGCEAGLSTVDHTIYSARREALSRRGPAVRVLVLGNSQAMVGVRPEFISRTAFNLAHNSQDPYYDFQLVHRFAGEMKNLELVVVSLSYFSLETKLSQSPEQWRRCFYYRFYGLPHEDEGPGLRHAADVSLVALYGREESFKLALRGFRSRREKIDDGGWPVAKAEPAPEAFTDDWTRTRIERHHALMKPENLAGNVAHLEGMIDGLKARNVRVALFSPPLTGAYRAHVRPEAVRRLQAAIAGLRERHGLRFVDYSADSRFVTADFKDVDHLNPRGAEKFTRILDAEVVEPALREGRP